MNQLSTGLAKYFQILQGLLTGAFSDLLFAGHQQCRPLVIQTQGMSCRWLRLRLPTLGYLHLESVQVFGGQNSVRENIGANAKLTCSSVYPGGESLLADRLLLNADNAGVGIHTDFGQGEWVCLDLEGEQVITEVVVHNRDDRWKWRAWGLVVEGSVDGKYWSALYDHSARQSQLIECLVKTCPHIGGSAHDLSAALECTEFVRLLLANELDECQKKLDTMLWAGTYGATEIRTQLSAAILSNYELEWNSHGIVRPFRYWTAEEKSEYLQQAKELTDDLAGLSNHICLGFGIVLAYVRDGDLIPHDDDADVLVALDRSNCPSISHGLAMLESHLRPLGYDVTGDQFTFSHRWVTKSTWNAALPHIDVFIGLKEGQAVSWYPGERGNLQFDEVFPAQKGTFLGISCSFPKQPIHYLDRIYGADWRKTDVKFGHPWNKVEFVDIA